MGKKQEVQQDDVKITLPKPDYRVAQITIKGDTPLLVNRFDSKSKQEIEDKQQGKAKQKKAYRDPEAEYKASLYVMPDSVGRYGVPAGGLKNCAVSACRFVDGVTMTVAKGAFHVLAGAGNLVEVKGKPVMDESIVRIGKFGNKIATPRYRGRFDEWEITFKVKYNARLITPEQLANLYETAGFSVGLCEWRPEKSGNLGMFSIKRAA